MKFIEVDHTPYGERMNTEENDKHYMWARYVRLDQFVEFRLIDNRFTGSDLRYFICGVLPNEERWDFDNIIATFDCNEYDKAKDYISKLVAKLNGDD